MTLLNMFYFEEDDALRNTLRSNLNRPFTISSFGKFNDALGSVSREKYDLILANPFPKLTVSELGELGQIAGNWKPDNVKMYFDAGLYLIGEAKRTNPNTPVVCYGAYNPGWNFMGRESSVERDLSQAGVVSYTCLNEDAIAEIIAKIDSALR